MKWNSYANNVRVIGLFPAFRSLPHTEKKQFVALQPHNKGNFVWYYVQYLAVQQKIIWTNDVELSQNLFCTICSQFFSFFLIKSPKRHSSLFSACRKKTHSFSLELIFLFYAKNTQKKTQSCAPAYMIRRWAYEKHLNVYISSSTASMRECGEQKKLLSESALCIEA